MSRAAVGAIHESPHFVSCDDNGPGRGRQNDPPSAGSRTVGGGCRVRPWRAPRQGMTDDRAPPRRAAPLPFPIRRSPLAIRHSPFAIRRDDNRPGRGHQNDPPSAGPTQSAGCRDDDRRGRRSHTNAAGRNDRRGRRSHTIGGPTQSAGPTQSPVPHNRRGSAMMTGGGAGPTRSPGPTQSAGSRDDDGRGRRSYTIGGSDTVGGVRR